MKPTNFKQSTKVLKRPSIMAESECQSLPVWCDGKQCVSCWKPSIRERLNILFSGKVWLGVLSGETQPPVYVTAECVFVKKSNKARFCSLISKTKESIIEVVKTVRDGFKQPDKRKHFIAGLFFSIIVGIFLPWLGVLFGFVTGALKELWDKKGKGTTEWMDFIFTCIGVLCAFPITLIIHNLIW